MKSETMIAVCQSFSWTALVMYVLYMFCTEKKSSRRHCSFSSHLRHGLVCSLITIKCHVIAHFPKLFGTYSQAISSIARLSFMRFFFHLFSYPFLMLNFLLKSLVERERVDDGNKKKFPPKRNHIHNRDSLKWLSILFSVLWHIHRFNLIYETLSRFRHQRTPISGIAFIDWWLQTQLISSFGMEHVKESKGEQTSRLLKISRFSFVIKWN